MVEIWAMSCDGCCRAKLLLPAHLGSMILRFRVDIRVDLFSLRVDLPPAFISFRVDRVDLFNFLENIKYKRYRNGEISACSNLFGNIDPIDPKR